MAGFNRERPKTRSELIQFRATDKERETLSDIADILGVNHADVIRASLDLLIETDPRLKAYRKRLEAV